MNAHHLIQSDEATWTGISRVWSSIQQYPPKRERSSWLLVAVAVVVVAVGLAVMS